MSNIFSKPLDALITNILINPFASCFKKRNGTFAIQTNFDDYVDIFAIVNHDIEHIDSDEDIDGKIPKNDVYFYNNTRNKNKSIMFTETSLIIDFDNLPEETHTITLIARSYESDTLAPYLDKFKVNTVHVIGAELMDKSKLSFNINDDIKNRLRNVKSGVLVRFIKKTNDTWEIENHPPMAA